MAKKRDKSKTKASSKKIKKISGKKAETIETKPIQEVLHNLDILAEEKKVEQEVKDIEKKEASIEQKETAIMAGEKKIEQETEKVEKLEKEIKKEVTPQPLNQFTIKDLNKGIVGAFIGVVAHFAFVYGKQIAEEISVARATVLVIFSYALIIILMYETGYREVKEKRLLGILPKRATAIYFISLIVVVIIFFLFNMVDLSDLTSLYKQIAVTSVLASVGAGTADLIGRD